LIPERAIFEEVAGTRWTPYEVRFALESRNVMADIEIGARGCLACLWVRDGALVAAMTRAGYSTSGDQSAWRSLRGVDDLVRERAMLERAVARPASMLAWPKRRAREVPSPMKRRIDPSLVKSMMRSRWEWIVTEVGRHGAGASVSCLVTDAGIEVGIRVEWGKKPPGPQIRAERRRLAAALGPFGYVSSNVRGEIVLEKSVRNARQARVERQRLDAFLG